MAAPLNNVPPSVSPPTAALFDAGAERLVFGRPVQAHDNIDKHLLPADCIAAQPQLTDREKSEKLLITACRTANTCLLYTSPSPRDRQKSRMPSSA